MRLSQVLNVIVESVHEAYDAMDSVFFGPEERDVTEIEFNSEPRITVAELLGWVEHFAGVEAPQLIADSGKDGVDAVRITLERLRSRRGRSLAVAELLGTWPMSTQAFGTRRVTESLKAIDKYLDDGALLAGVFRPVKSSSSISTDAKHARPRRETCSGRQQLPRDRSRPGNDDVVRAGLGYES